MTKARTLADFISDGSPLADGTVDVSEVSGAAPLANPTFTGTASGTFSGPLTGNVTGNVTGDVTGEVTGDVVGNITGNVTGDVAGELDLSPIASTIADTAVDVFVYDTSKDSDGGAWRKRTQGTSWYNETLNTATRGSRKEFPAVAVIVAESNQVTIYDGDDPSLPMWASWSQYNAPSQNLTWWRMLRSAKCVSALNGIIIFGQEVLGDSASGLNFIDFNKDIVGRYATSVLYGGIGMDASSGTKEQNLILVSLGLIVNANVNDVAMTVLPNAPIDAATGLPVPTIAVATDGGVSVIKDDGTVHNKSGTGVKRISHYNKDSFITMGFDALTIQEYNDTNTAMNYLTGSRGYNGNPVTGYYPRPLGSDRKAAALSDRSFALAGNKLQIFAEEPNVKDGESGTLNPIARRTMVVHAGHDFNTGWMNGDIKLATLSDTDDTDVTGSELVTNGTFDSDVSGWSTPVSGYTTFTWSSGTLQHTASGGTGRVRSPAIAVVAGKTYTFSVEVTAKTADSSSFVHLGTSAGASNIKNNITQDEAVGTSAHTFTATTSSVFIELGAISGNTVNYDNVSLRLAEEDRSVNGNGLQVFGTVTKTPVATGADLVAYSGFNSSNLLIQPHNDDLDFGTGDFAVFAWMQYGTASQTNIIDYAEYNSSTGRFEFYLDSNKVIRVAVGITYVSLGTASASGWSLFCVTRQNGLVKAYENGKEMGTTTSLSGSIGGSNHKLWVGTNYLGGGAAGGQKLSLLRVSTTVPSPEQIAKIYNDEKVLFQENAQATLYGSSDAVTALAYDDSTELLHVGTSAGRSDFQGLRRVNNTTNAVGAAISASNGMIVEE